MVIVHLARILRRVRHKKSFGLGFIILMLSFCIVGNALCFYVFDGEAKEATFGDSLWYSVISITTIGYGDYYASSTGARLGTLFFIVFLGLGTFSVILGMSIDLATEMASRGRRGMSNIIAKDHIVIVNFPAESRLIQILQELKSDPSHSNREIVIVTDQIEELPFTEHGVLFVNGPVLEDETYQRAKINDAAMVIVLATSYTDFNSDAVVASAVSVIDLLNPNVFTVAECLNNKHRVLFDSVNCNSIVFSMKLSGNLLAQEAQDPGVSQLVDVITSNTTGTTLFSIEVDSTSTKSYQDLAKELLDRDVNLICVNRGDDSLTSFREISPASGDRVIFAAAKRLSWSELVG